MPARSEPAAAVDHIEHQLEFLAAALPSRSTDDETGRRRFAVYVSVLAGYSSEAIAFMCREALRRCEWFPVPKVMLEILADYRAPESERSSTLRLCQAFAQDAFVAWIGNVWRGEPLGDVPEQWLRMAVERGAVRRLEDGLFISRALFVGPTMERKYA